MARKVTTPKLTIRTATEDDACAISALIRRNADVVLAAIYSTEQLIAWKRYNSPARIRQRIGERTTVCAFQGKRLCATIALQGFELAGLYVNPRSRGQGIGGVLLAHLESFAAAHGIARLHLTSTPAALEFYLRHGWSAGKSVVLKVLEVDFEETTMSKRLDQKRLGGKPQSRHNKAVNPSGGSGGF